MNISWVIVRTEPSLWTVGFYGPDGKWQPNSDYNSQAEADRRCHWLNGGDSDDSQIREALLEVEKWNQSDIDGFEDIAPTLAMLEARRYAIKAALAANRGQQ